MLFAVFLVLLCWAVAMCGGIIYMAKRKRPTSKAAVEPVEEVEMPCEAPVVLRGWSEGELFIRKEGEDCCIRLGFGPRQLARTCCRP